MSSSSPLDLFHPLVRDWFTSRFDAPTDAQTQGWPAIAEGRHTLVAAPTGSGKTLAAFMICLDGLVRQALDGGLPDRTQVVYVSPLKALSNDIRRNLQDPLEGISALAEQRGIRLPEIRVAVRTGDTPQSERQAMAKRPPHVLITTPESFYILLTSKSGRKGLEGARTLILDELHAVADDKRGSHLSISAERLSELAEEPVTRIGLSATQKPIEEVARFLVGMSNIASDGTPDCLIVDTGHAREMDLALEIDDEAELGPIATHEQRDRYLDRVAELVKEHDTTILFVNTRRLVERLAHQMSQRIGEDALVAHHGSLSHEIRREAEQKLKDGEVKLCVATSSLELGIDVGAVDLVCQIGSPRSIGLLIQRVGRSGHFLGGMPKGRLFPLTRDELMECLALIRGIKRGNLDTLHIPPWPTDILAQQIVAECASQDWGEDALFDLFRQAYPYRELPREKYDGIVEMLSNGVAPREGRRGAYLHRDSINGVLKGRRGARLAALTSGGAIPDNADYDVIAEPENTFVGTVNEDFAIESMRGDVFLLGNTPWRILRTDMGKLRVEDATGSNPTIPFWLGEAPGRTTELSDEVSDLREELYERMDGGEGIQWLIDELGVSRNIAEQALAYIVEGVRILGTVPTKKRVVAERFFDETGGMQLIIHAPFGSLINRAWGMSLRKEICRTFDFELQAAATENGLNFALGPSLSFPLEDVYRYVPIDKIEKVLTQAVLQAPLFPVRWRWDASRSLALLRFSGGKKVPPPLLRMRSDDLLASVFPAQVMCQDNAMPGDVEVPDHPLVFEAMRDCLTEAMDVEGLKSLLESIEGGQIEVFARDTAQPSVFSHEILNSMPYTFLDEDDEVAERRSRMVALRRALPEDARDLAALDQAAVDRASQDAWPLVRDADELHDALLTLGVLPESDVARGAEEPEAEQWTQWLDELVKSGRAGKATYGEGRTAWVATESVPTVAAAFPDVRFEPVQLTLSQQGEGPTQDEAELFLVRSRTESSGPTTLKELSDILGIRLTGVEIALANLENTGNILRGQFTPGRVEEEVCDRRVLARIHRETIARLRKEVAPVSAATYIRFLLRWQHAVAPWRVREEGGLLETVDQLQGFEAAAGAWESDILPTRVIGFGPSMLDEVCTSGEVVWGRFSRRMANGEVKVNRTTASRTVPISLGNREALPWLLNASPDSEDSLLGAAKQIVEFLDKNGASFLPDIMSGIRRLPSEVEDTLWQLAAAGLVTSDGFAAVRGRVDGTTQRVKQSSRYKRQPRRRKPTSRWSLLESFESPEDAVEERAIQLLHRYGIVFPEVLAREANAPRWRELVRVYRRAEARGEIRGGRFVTGFIGEQFALPEAVETMRNARNAEADGKVVVVSACDPLNLAGVLTPGPKVPALLGNKLAFRDGVPVASVVSGQIQWHTEPDEETRTQVLQLIGQGRSTASPRRARNRRAS